MFVSLQLAGGGCRKFKINLIMVVLCIHGNGVYEKKEM